MSLRRHRLIGLLTAVLLLALLAAACGAEDPMEDAAVDEPPEDADPGAVTVGSANFPESVLLANIYAGALESSGIEVNTQLNIGSREIYFAALEQGELDLLPEYLGSLHNHVTGGDEEITETEELLEDLRDELGPEILVLEPAEAQNRNAHLITPETAEEYGLETLSDLGPVSGELVAGGPPEARERPDGLPGLKEVYGIEFADYRDLDVAGPLTIESLMQGDIDVARAYETMGVIAEEGWINLEDDQNLLNAENVTPIIREDAHSDEIEETLNAVAEVLTTEELIEMNRRIEIDNEDPDLVAEDWLQENGFLD